MKHKKAAADAKRGKLFTKLIKELTVAARLGGGDVDGNPRLRTAVAAAKAANMPADNIKRAIQKGTGELPGVSYEEVTYEGYGPGGVAILIETLTDNRMRTTPEIRHLFSKHNGNMGEPNSVAWMFHKRGRLTISADSTTEETLLEIALEAGAEDIEQIEEHFEVSTPPEAFHTVQEALEAAEVEVEVSEAGLVMEPQNTVTLEGQKAAQCLRLLDLLEDQDDAQNVWANLEVDADELESSTA
ncbi:MAG: YebC/PmpR family DNA-binding transcriptional regulator [Acidobacteria bacterium]|nr:YebC/PmpR family DNA-binding transcriptional regulator [Acidobacteriota bacterium]NIM60104.1 YebC/PmpR family DNA-binding transcriptional regulator [Acidobacteriota bacterium]NIO59462.1 YebC/PmpR family DNA-binding transcriptional regulator [Acidobacteriota bacterium]NIQ30493.1 YebC/PmpR family DNA-binding transcriptional regulator [Acidobacteriota bacterium]NIQ85432.1 YebC/PmpR family DNA-binding transcriptional regulator [Acidobacteriota bacterium]